MEFTSRDNEQIWYKIWEAANGSIGSSEVIPESAVSSPRAIIQVFAGFAEVTDYYDDFAAEMVRNGYTVAMHEYRKHGRNRAAYGEGNLFRNFARDGAQLCGILRNQYPGVPVILLAHSLGTAVSQISIYEKMERWDGVIYTGPSDSVIAKERKENLLEIAERDILLHGADEPNVMIYPTVFGRLNAPFARERSSLAFITSDPDRRKWLTSLPYPNPEYTNRFFRDFILLTTDIAVRETLENTAPPLTDTPVLLLTGSDDVTAENGTYGDTKAKLMRNAGYRDVTSIVYPGFRHSILQELEWRKVADDITAWMGERF